MSIREIWEQYKRQRDGDHFTDHASFVFVPTTSGAIGYDAVRQFLSTAYDPRALKIKENVLVQTVGEDSIVEESETTINFVSGEGVWLVPGIDSRYIIDGQVVIPTITSATFEGDRISSVRVYWDQASVLKQLRLIGDKNSWPIVSNRQADAIRDIASAHLNPFGRSERLAAGVARMNINQPEPRRPVHTSSRVNNPGGTGGKSSVFGDNDTYDENARSRSNNIEQQQGVPPGRRPVHTSSRVNQPGGTGGKSSVFGDNDTHDESSQRSRFNSNKNASQFSIGDEQDISDPNIEQPGRRPVHTSSRVNQPGGTGGKSSVFGDNDTYDENARRPVHTSSRVNQPGGAGGKSSVFGDNNDTYDENTSNITSNIEQQEVPPGRRPVHTSSRVNQPGGTGGKSSVFGDSDTYDESNTKQQQRSSRFHSNKNVSQFSIGDEDVNDTQQDNVSISGSSKRRGKSQFESSVEFGDDSQQQRPSVKPSSRILKPPGGGGSQFTFG